jgi:hypothetical protein
LTIQINDFLHEICIHENAEMTERTGFVESIDLITLREKLRKHGVAR